MIVEKLLASAPTVEKQLTKGISEDEAVYLGSIPLILTILFISKILSILWAFPRSKVRLEDGPKVTALMDSGAATL